MTTPTQDIKPIDNKPSEKEINFRQLEAKYERQLAQERADKERLQEELNKRHQQQIKTDDDDDDSDEPYVDKKRLNKKLDSFERKMEEKIEKKAEEKARSMIESQRTESWLQQNSDFEQTMQHAEKFAELHPKLAENILRMPAGFERQKLVYENIKAFGLDKPQAKPSTIQDKVDANRRSPFYQPNGVGSSPYAGQQSDFSPSGQKAAHDKMMELKGRLRL
jgi:hypothetical protein